MPSLGVFCLALATLSALAGVILGLARPGQVRALRMLQIVTLAGGAGALGLLAALVALGDPTVAYAVEHRAPPGAPWGYRIAAVWAGQAGGLLLWVVETALVGLAVHPRTQPRAVALLGGLQGCLLGLALLANPFAPAAPAAAGGLNPVLQNPMMLIHPPMLFLGYALLAVPFAITLAALLERRAAAWPAQVWPWVLLSGLTLTAGNGFGAVWAYKTFGWGGFWSWDPVENTSFVPWLLTIATVHCLWLAPAHRRWLPVAALGAVGSFLTVLYGSFLARSGLLAGASVHAYVEGERLFVWALGLLLVGGSVLSAGLLARAWRPWSQGAGEGREAPRLVPPAWGTRLLLAVAGVVLAGMSLPLVGAQPDTTAYDTALLPFAVLILLLLAWPRAWQRSTAEAWARGLVAGVFALLVVASLLALGLATPGGVAPAVGFVFAPFLLLAGAVVLLSALGGCLTSRRPWRQRGAYVAHAGLGALLLGATVAGYASYSEQQFLGVGQEAVIAGHTVKLISVARPTPTVRAAELLLAGRTGCISMEDDAHFQSPLRHAWILKRPWGDVYLTPLDILVAAASGEGQNPPAGVMLEFTLKPGMPLVWLGMWLIALGLALALVRRLTDGRAPLTDPGTA